MTFSRLFFSLMPREIFNTACTLLNINNLFQAYTHSLCDYVWKRPGFINVNSVISSNTETMYPFLFVLSLLWAITAHGNYFGISMNVVTFCMVACVSSTTSFKCCHVNPESKESIFHIGFQCVSKMNYDICLICIWSSTD